MTKNNTFKQKLTKLKSRAWVNLEGGLESNLISPVFLLRRKNTYSKKG